MSKLVRLYGKKRGSRMSGWWVIGSVGEAAFFATLFLLGIVSLSIDLFQHVMLETIQVDILGLR